MIAIEAFSAVFNRTIAGLEQHIEVVEPATGDKTTSPCAEYAMLALETLRDRLKNPALVSLCGPTGSTVAAFDKAWQASEDGRLTGPDFGRRRARRIHPFTLVKSLQNQVPATLSMRFDLTGPCLNLLDSSRSLAWVLPNIEAMIKQCGQVLLVLSTACDREEERVKLNVLQPKRASIEGAICFLLNDGPGLGSIEGVKAGVADTSEMGAPVLDGGIQLLRAVTGESSSVIELKDGDVGGAAISWRRN